MKFRQPPKMNPGSAEERFRGSLVDRPLQRPDWLKEWIDNKAKYVLLACGHKVDLKDRSQTTLEGLGEDRHKVLTDCRACGQFCAIERGLSYNEFKGIPTAVIPDEPLF